MISFTISETLPKRTSLLLPIYVEDADPKRRKMIEKLTRAQKRTLRGVLQKNSLPKSGIVPIFTADGTVYLQILGKKEELTRRDIRDAGTQVCCLGKKYEEKTFTILPGSLKGEFLNAFEEGVLLGSYEFEIYKGEKKSDDKKKKEKEVKLESVHFLQKKDAKLQARLAEYAAGVARTKDVINTPPSDARPTYLENAAKEIAKEKKEVSLKVLKEKELEKLGCGGILGVGRGSNEESRLIILEYKGGKKDEKPIALVGKGVTFDTGGHNIKGRFMRWMKQDLGGAATVMGAFQAIVNLGIKKNVLCVVPAVENMVSPDAYFPDDVLRMHNGMTVEVDNTDAEGRLILADALSYTDEKYKPRIMIDLATLTGACVYAVGNDFSAILGNKKVIDGLKKSADATDELVWELPLHQPYAKKLKSSIADIVNCSDGLKPGTIEGGLFLQNFVGKDTPWVHMDIASVAFDEGKGLATGRNIRLLVDFVEKN